MGEGEGGRGKHIESLRRRRIRTEIGMDQGEWEIYEDGDRDGDRERLGEGKE